MKILVIKLSSCGDLFHALPAVRNIRRGLNAEIHWLAHDEYKDLVACFADVSRVIGFPRRNFGSQFPRFWRELRQDSYDMVLDFQGLFKSGFSAFLARSPRRIGPSFHREASAMFYSAIAGHLDKHRHAVDECMDIARFLGVSCLNQEFPVAYPPREVPQPRPRIAILPVSRWETKNWPVDSFIEAARRLRQDLSATLFLLGSKADQPACDRIAQALPPDATVNLAGTLSLPETGGVLQAMDLLIANDSGPVHMAAAVGTPTLVLFGPTDPLRTGPYGNDHHILRTSRDCQPCYSRECPFPGLPCMTGITPDQVVAEARAMLDTIPQPAPSARQPLTSPAS
jgi:lipopolysaccharide heptosyltransferase I